MGFPAGKQGMNGSRIRGRGQFLAERAIGEHLCKFREDLQMLLGRLLRHQQHEQQTHRLAVRRVELYRGSQAEKGADRFLQALDAAMRDGHALAEPGRTELFPREEAVEYRTASDALVVFEHDSRLLEDALLAAGIEIDLDVGKGQKLGDQVHGDTATADGCGNVLAEASGAISLWGFP